MRKILHTSDLHFGRTNAVLVETLIRKTRELNPDIFVVSGDLTQRARKAQFVEARQFLDMIDCRKVVVPGNHDIPMENVAARFFRPLTNYRKYISEDLWPTYEDEEMVILGINTARPFMRRSGWISNSQIDRARRFFCGVDVPRTKVLVTHHPFDFPETVADRHLLRRARHAIDALALCEADLYLAGHVHVPFAGSTARRYKATHRTALIVQAGTALSTRTRSEPNSFNLICVDRPLITVRHYVWDRAIAEFLVTSDRQFHHSEHGWQ
jgi:3',5'-cyclic AMP phosphodiesterase CpdA